MVVCEVVWRDGSRWGSLAWMCASRVRLAGVVRLVAGTHVRWGFGVSVGQERHVLVSAWADDLVGGEWVPLAAVASAIAGAAVAGPPCRPSPLCPPHEATPALLPFSTFSTGFRLLSRKSSWSGAMHSSDNSSAERGLNIKSYAARQR